MPAPQHRSNEGAVPLAFESAGPRRGPIQSAPHKSSLWVISPFALHSIVWLPKKTLPSRISMPYMEANSTLRIGYGRNRFNRARIWSGFQSRWPARPCAHLSSRRLKYGVVHHGRRFIAGIYDRRMQRFNLTVIVAALVALAIMILSRPFLQRPRQDGNHYGRPSASRVGYRVIMHPRTNS